LKEEAMGYKKIIIIAIFLIAHLMIFSSTYCEARTLEEIKKDMCPAGKVKMINIVKNNSKFSWMKPNETVLVFPIQDNFPDSELQAIMEPEAKNYARDSLRLIPPTARTKKFLRLYKEAIYVVRGAESKVTTPMVVEAFKSFRGCCIPLDMGKTEIPDTYQGLSYLINDSSKNEKPPAEDLSTAPED
jgi:hypothetical protein